LKEYRSKESLITMKKNGFWDNHLDVKLKYYVQFTKKTQKIVQMNANYT
jgi:hypothetical protein